MRRLLAVALVALGAGACTTTTVDSTTDPTTTTTLAIDLLRDQKFAARALADIVTAAGAEVVQLRSVDYYPTYLIVELQDPDNPEHIDRYEWRDGDVEPPEPVQLSGPQEDVEAELFPSTAVDWRTVPELVETAKRAVEGNRPLRIEEPVGSYVFVGRSSSLDLDGRVVLDIYISGPRRSGYVQTTSSGEILAVNIS